MSLCECVFPHVMQVSNFDNYLFFDYFSNDAIAPPPSMLQIGQPGDGNDVYDGLLATGPNRRSHGVAKQSDMLHNNNILFTSNYFLKTTLVQFWTAS